MIHLFINPSCERIWRIQYESSDGKRAEPVDIKAMTFQDAIMDWWQGEAEDFPHDVKIEMGGSCGGVLSFYIEDGNTCDFLQVWDVTKDYDPDSISCEDLIERRKQERLAKKGRKQ